MSRETIQLIKKIDGFKGCGIRLFPPFIFGKFYCGEKHKEGKIGLCENCRYKKDVFMIEETAKFTERQKLKTAVMKEVDEMDSFNKINPRFINRNKLKQNLNKIFSEKI